MKVRCGLEQRQDDDEHTGEGGGDFRCLLKRIEGLETGSGYNLHDKRL